MAAILITIMVVILPIVNKNYILWFKDNSLKIVCIFAVCAYIDLYLIYKLLIN